MNPYALSRIALLALLAAGAAAGGCIFEVKFDSTPSGAEVLFGDVPVGNTPLVMLFNADNRTVTALTNGGTDRLRFERAVSRPWWSGSTVTVRKPGFEPVVRELKFKGPDTHNFDLRPLPGKPGAAAPPASAAVAGKATAPEQVAVVTGIPVADSPASVVTGVPASPGYGQAGGSQLRVGRVSRARPQSVTHVLVGTPIEGAPQAASTIAAGSVDSGARRVEPLSGKDVVSILDGLDRAPVEAAPASSPAKAVPMGSIGLSFFSIDPTRATSIDHLVYGADFSIPMGIGQDFDIDLLLDVAFANVVVRRNGPSVRTDLVLGFELGIGLQTLLPRKLIPVDLGKEAWLRFGGSLEVPFIYSLLKGDTGAFGYATGEGEDPPTNVDYIFFGVRLSLYTELHGKADWNIIVPRAGFGFDILWQGTINGIDFKRDGFPMLMMLGAKLDLGKHTFLAFDFNFWTDQVEIALSLDSKV